MVCNFRDKVIKGTAGSSSLSGRAAALGETNCRVKRTLKPCGEVHVTLLSHINLLVQKRQMLAKKQLF